MQLICPLRPRLRPRPRPATLAVQGNGVLQTGTPLCNCSFALQLPEREAEGDCRCAVQSEIEASPIPPWTCTDTVQLSCGVTALLTKRNCMWRKPALTEWSRKATNALSVLQVGLSVYKCGLFQQQKLAFWKPFTRLSMDVL